MKKLVLIFIFSLSNILLSQSKKFFGVVSDKIDVIGDVNIYNVNSKRSNITTDKGEFEIFANLKDTLEFSYLGYKTTRVIVNINHLGMVGLQVKLKKEVIALDAVYVKRNNLLGQLDIDVDKVQNTEDFTRKLRLPFPNAKAATYAQRKMTFGGGGSIGALYGLLSGERRKMKIMLKAKQTEEEVILLEKKYSYFVLKDLNIRKENVFRFLFFCYESEGFGVAKRKINRLMNFMVIKAKQFRKLN